MSAFGLPCKVLALVIGAAGLSGSPAIAGDAPSAARAATVQVGATRALTLLPAAAPRGFLDFCRRRPTECMENGSAETSQDVISRASSLYWAGVFGKAPQSGAPAATAVPVDSPLSRADWNRVFASTVAPAADIPATAAPQPMTTTASSMVSASAQSLDPEGRGMSLWATEQLPRLSSVPVYHVMGTLEVAAAVHTTSAEGRARYPVDDLQSPPFEMASEGSDLSARLAASVSAMTPAVQHVVLPMTSSSILADLGALRSSSQSGSVFNSANLALPLPSPPQVESFSISLDRTGWALVNGVNRDMNRRIRRSSDIRDFGVEDFWQVPGGSNPRGDCEDYVLAKRRALIARGIPAAALSIAIVKTHWGESHAVLLLAADGDEFVLDNLTPWISRREQVNYDWQERQAPGKVFEWVRMAT